MNLIKRIRKYAHWFYYILPRKRFSREDFNNKKNSICATLTKDEYDSLKKQWGKFYSRNRFNSNWFALYKSLDHSYALHLYVPDDVYYMYVDEFFANRVICQQVDDKNLYNLLFHDVLQPRTVARRINGIYLNSYYQQIGFDEFINLCVKEGRIVLKQSINSEGGKGVFFFDLNEDGIDILKNCAADNYNFVVQEVIKQHASITKLHSKSINTIRIVTLFFKEEVRILSSVLRMGIGEALVDNASSGGIVCGIDSSGRLKSEAFDVKANRYYCHPSGVKFEDIVIPNFNNCINLCRSLAFRVLRFSRLVSWDIAISEDGSPLLLEVNLSFGQVDFHQMCNGPIFGSDTFEIMSYVYENNRMLHL